ncbi:inorganic pyrophosphatase [Chrysochromulina tobinii]|uniref:inorganic diphosphatase n=1 Tax=Chrysochromulina tobinii TaxID=1460289 RepID=A0A0M0JVQ3_9EUKA|nr:inorganic pyrophosphatase [Chrysochromulina tobinii]|eukprot:KOO30619.1 inorganic pyrophosphatase [Chrysochromulina sp. CCMP291]
MLGKLSATYVSVDAGAPKTFEYRRFLEVSGAKASYWHDVPLKVEGGVSAVVEITRNTTAKMEIATDEAGTPIKQDIKKGKLREYNMPIKWNYGAIPQTWEEPGHLWPGLESYGGGDNDPLDFVDLSSSAVPCGAVIAFKPLAALAMIDEGEVDWKVIGLNMADPSAASINSLAELEAAMPGQIDEVREWFTWYKALDANGKRIPDSEPNVFGFEGRRVPL